MRELRGHFHSVVATGRNGALPVQRMRSLPQDERDESAVGEAAASTGKEGSDREHETAGTSERELSRAFPRKTRACVEIRPWTARYRSRRNRIGFGRLL